MKTNLDVIDRVAYRVWSKDPVTKAIFEELHRIRAQVNTTLTDGAVIMGDQMTAVRSLGMRDGLDVLLQVEAEDFAIEEK